MGICMDKNGKSATDLSQGLGLRDGHRFTQISELDELNPITEKIIGCAYMISNALGAGFLEKVYENALAME
jgi:hypothetical protein